MNIEQELTAAINTLLDEASAKGDSFTMTSIARAAIDRHGCQAPLEAVTDLVGQTFTQRNEPGRRFQGPGPG